MNVSTIVISQTEAASKLREYDALAASASTPEDDLLREVYRAAAAGTRILNLHAAFREVGLNERGEPRLAVARADWDRCVFHPDFVIQHGHCDGAGSFTQRRAISPRLRVNCVTLPAKTFDIKRLARPTIWSPVPHIPPRLRPRPSYLARYHVLFEVEKWQQYPIDPFLLRHITGPFYRVEAEWELTALEASLLSALAS